MEVGADGVDGIYTWNSESELTLTRTFVSKLWTNSLLISAQESHELALFTDIILFTVGLGARGCVALL